MKKRTARRVLRQPAPWSLDSTDRQESEELRLPDFFIIGAAKAGTTSIYAMLDQHPDIFLPARKEPEFFARDDLYGAGLESYAALFADARPGQVTGEASTLYSLSPFFPEAPARIKAHVPDAKLIYILREPVSRAYSFYVQLIKNYQNVTRDRQVHRTFEDFVLPERHAHAAPRQKVLSRVNDHLPDVPELCLAGSDYLLQIEAYLAFFSREQMLFLTFDDFLGDQQSTLRRITDFLGVDALSPAVFEQEGVVRNVAKQHFDSMSRQLAIDALKRRWGPLWHLSRAIPFKLREYLKPLLVNPERAGKTHVPPTIEPQTESLLYGRFAAQRPELEAVTGLDLNGWAR